MTDDCKHRSWSGIAPFCDSCGKKMVELTDAKRPSRANTMMAVAEVISLRSTCPRLSVGAIITRDGRIISTGYNGRPAGLPHCTHDLDTPGLDEVHAEANAIAFAARHGVSVLDAELYTTHQPCLDCAKLIINAGLSLVMYWQPYRLSAGLDLLRDAGVRAVHLVHYPGLEGMK